jgi:hypothetical protein
MDGYEVARRLREEAGLRDVLIVAVTGYGREQDRARSVEAGIDHYLVKPVVTQAVAKLLTEPVALLAFDPSPCMRSGPANSSSGRSMLAQGPPGHPRRAASPGSRRRPSRHSRATGNREDPPACSAMTQASAAAGACAPINS